VKSFGIRSLTPGERALAFEVFGAALDSERVRILAQPLWPRAFVAGPSMIVWPGRAAPTDFADAPLVTQAVFVHELTHVWQAQTGVRLLRAKLRAGDSPAAYAYDLDRQPDFAALNIEQQAMVVEHAFLAARGAPTPFAPDRYAAVAAGWRRV